MRVNDWPVALLGDLVNIVTGKLDSNQAVPGGRYPFFTCSPRTLEIDSYAFDCEAVLLAGNNANGIFSVKYYEGKFDAYQRTYVITPKASDVFSGRFLYYLVKEKVKTFGGFSIGTATRFLTLPLIKDVSVSVPPRQQQDLIAQILGSMDDRIDNNNAINQTLELMARATFKSWFVDFDPVREGLPRALVASSLGQIPEAWDVGVLGDIAENPRRGVAPAEVDPGTAYIGLEHMPRRSIALGQWEDAVGLESNKFRFFRGEILFGKLRPYFHKVGIAAVDGICSTDILVMVPRQDSYFGFVLALVSSEEFVQYADRGSAGTKMPRTNWSDMARYRTVIPPEPIARVFTEIMKPMVEKIAANIHESRTLAALRDTLLPKLLSGEVRVKQAEKIVGEAI